MNYSCVLLDLQEGAIHKSERDESDQWCRLNIHDNDNDDNSLY